MVGFVVLFCFSDGLCFLFPPFFFPLLDLGGNPPALEGEVNPRVGAVGNSQGSMQNASHDF